MVFTHEALFDFIFSILGGQNRLPRELRKVQERAESLYGLQALGYLYTGAEAEMKYGLGELSK